MARKTLYIPDEHEATYARAKELAESSGSKVSNIFADALVRYVEEREMQLQELEEVTLWIGTKNYESGNSDGKYVQFFGKKIAAGKMEVGPDEELTQELYRTKKGKYYLYSCTNTESSESCDGVVAKGMKDLQGQTLTTAVAAELKNEKSMVEILDI